METLLSPEIQEILARYSRQRAQSPSSSIRPENLRAGAQTARSLRDAGLKVPKGYELDIGTGEMHKNNDGGFLDAPAWAWALPAAGMAAPLAFPAAAGAGTLASSSVPTSLAMSAVPGGATGAASAGSTGMFGSLLSFGKDLLKNPKDLISGLGSAFGAGADAAASNRGTALDAALEQEKLRQQQMRDYFTASRDAFDTGMSRAQEVRSGEGDAWRKLQQAAYVGNAPGAASLNLAGPYSRSVAGPTSVERGAANTMRDEMVNRMRSLGGQYALPDAISAPKTPDPYTIDDGLLKPGLWETIQGYTGEGMKALGGIPVNRGQVNG
jgi:hypothetical protein